MVHGVTHMNPEFLILGGGPAGCAAAITLARAGRNVTLVEREAKPKHKICGEFLSTEALTYLHYLGVHPRSLGATSIHAVRLATRSRHTTAPLPFDALSLTRHTLDEALLQSAEASGVTVLRGSAVHSLTQTQTVQKTWCATLAGGVELRAPHAFLATGKHDLRAHARPPGKQSNLIAFKMYFRLTPGQSAALAGHVELMLYRGGYAGLQPVEQGVANLCCLIDRKLYLDYGGTWHALLSAMRGRCSLLRERMRDAQQLLDKPLAVSPIPYGFLRKHAMAENLWALGDQAAVIPSFTGDGMSIALHSGILAADACLRGESSEQYQQSLNAELSRQVKLATLFSRGLTHSLSRSVLAAGARLWPSAIGTVAHSTRLQPLFEAPGGVAPLS